MPQETEEDPTRAREEQMHTLLQQCGFIAEKLDAITLLRWFVEYPERYNEEFFNCRRKNVSLSYTLSPSLQALATYAKAGRIVISQGKLML